MVSFCTCLCLTANPIFNNTNNEHTLPLSKISDMFKNTDPMLFGNPQEFDYTVSIMIRANNTFYDKAPDYL